MSEDFLEKSAERTALSSVDLDMVICEVCCGGGWIYGGAGNCLGGAMDAGPTRGAWCCLGDVCGGGRTGVSVLILMSLCLLDLGSGM